MNFCCQSLIVTLKLLEPCNTGSSPMLLHPRCKRYSLSTSVANSRTMPKSLFNPTCAWLILAGIFRSPREFLRGTMPVGGGSVARPSEADCGELGPLIDEGFGAMDGEGSSTAGCKSSDSRPAASDSEAEMMERSDAIDLRGSCSRGGDGG